MFNVYLTAVGNIDHDEDPCSFICPSACVLVENLEAARSACLEYIRVMAIGAGNWSGGHVYDEDGTYMGRVSYNGCFWKVGSKYA